eukprot:1402786-Rhodomonas_salina.1
MSGTDKGHAYRATLLLRLLSYTKPCPVLYGMPRVLPLCYEMSSTDVRYGPTRSNASTSSMTYAPARYCLLRSYAIAIRCGTSTNQQYCAMVPTRDLYGLH